jgi:hypothetical protein
MESNRFNKKCATNYETRMHADFVISQSYAVSGWQSRFILSRVLL